MEIEILSDIHFLSTSLMVGIIWVIQLLHYPTFHFIKQSDYVEFQHFHMQRISFIVVPVMIIEILSGFMLVYYFRSNLFILCLTILLVIWLIKFVFFTKLLTYKFPKENIFLIFLFLQSRQCFIFFVFNFIWFL